MVMEEKFIEIMVADKSTQKAVFVMPDYAEGQVKRYLMFLGWDTVAIVEYADIDAALSSEGGSASGGKDTNDPTMLKAKGMVVN